MPLAPFFYKILLHSILSSDNNKKHFYFCLHFQEHGADWTFRDGTCLFEWNYFPIANVIEAFLCRFNNFLSAPVEDGAIMLLMLAEVITTSSVDGKHTFLWFFVKSIVVKWQLCYFVFFYVFAGVWHFVLFQSIVLGWMKP